MLEKILYGIGLLCSNLLTYLVTLKRQKQDRLELIIQEYEKLYNSERTRNEELEKRIFIAENKIRDLETEREDRSKDQQRLISELYDAFKDNESLKERLKNLGLHGDKILKP